MINSLHIREQEHKLQDLIDSKLDKDTILSESFCQWTDSHSHSFDDHQPNKSPETKRQLRNTPAFQFGDGKEVPLSFVIEKSSVDHVSKLLQSNQVETKSDSETVKPHLFIDWKTDQVKQVKLDPGNVLTYEKSLLLSGIYDIGKRGAWVLTENIGKPYFSNWTNWYQYMESQDVLAAWHEEFSKHQDKAWAFVNKFTPRPLILPDPVPKSTIDYILVQTSINNAEMLNFGVEYEMPALVSFIISQPVKTPVQQS